MTCPCGEPVLGMADFCAEHQAQYLDQLREIELVLVAQAMASRLGDRPPAPVLVGGGEEE